MSSELNNFRQSALCDVRFTSVLADLIKGIEIPWMDDCLPERKWEKENSFSQSILERILNWLEKPFLVYYLSLHDDWRRASKEIVDLNSVLSGLIWISNQEFQFQVNPAVSKSRKLQSWKFHINHQANRNFIICVFFLSGWCVTCIFLYV